MSKKEDEKSKPQEKDDQNLPKPQATGLKDQDEKKDDEERSLEQIEKELDELRPKPISPKLKRHIENEQKKKDQESIEKHQEKGSAPSEETQSGEEVETHHKDNELTPGEPDPTVNDKVKIPVLNERGDIELKPQQGSALNRKTNNSTSNTTEPADNNDQKKE